jgi:hypothetical protein
MTPFVNRELSNSNVVAISFCPKCGERCRLSAWDTHRKWKHCGAWWTAKSVLSCPHPGCGFRLFPGQYECPRCEQYLEGAVPWEPVLTFRSRLLDWILSDSRDLQIRAERAQREFDAMRSCWAAASQGRDWTPKVAETRFEEDLQAAQARHFELLQEFQEDVEKFLYRVANILAPREVEYSRNYQEELNQEIAELLKGVLGGETSDWRSLGFLTLCADSKTYSKSFLKAEIQRRYYQQRAVPRPGFQLTLEYAKNLSGAGFEHWLERLLRAAGIPRVEATQASRDQCADVIVMGSARKIVIQAKQVADSLGNAVVQEAISGRIYYSADEAWVVTTSTFTSSAIDLAQKAGVTLVDGSRLLNLPELVSHALRNAKS